MVTEMTDRERLAADLELLGMLGDPTRGPLANLYSPLPPCPQAIARPATARQWWLRQVTAALVAWQRLRAVRPHTANRLPERAAAPTR